MAILALDCLGRDGSSCLRGGPTFRQNSRATQWIGADPSLDPAAKDSLLNLVRVDFDPIASRGIPARLGFDCGM